MKYQTYTLHNFRQIPQVSLLSQEEIRDIEVVGRVLPFKTNNYVVDQLIDWDHFQKDPMYILTFPQRGMLSEKDYHAVDRLLDDPDQQEELKRVVHQIRMSLNPHPAGQREHNMPELDGEKLPGLQHKYHETAVFFPSQGQTCHAYCTFCFRWPQFTGINEYKFAMKEGEKLVRYIQEHPEISDLLITGGDPMTMKSSIFARYIDALIEAKIPHLKTIRIGSKSLAFWPYRFTTDADAAEMLAVFQRIVDAGINLAYMAHFNHYAELETEEVRKAVSAIRKTGAIIRTQSPILKHINDRSEVWSRMWKLQTQMGMIPYYMFIARDTGARNFFAVPLVKAHRLFRAAFSKVSGIGRTVRGPSMSANPGKVNVLGTTYIKGERYLALRFIQGRNPDWVGRPFFAKYNEEALWLDDLEPAFGEEEFFYEEELNQILQQ